MPPGAMNRPRAARFRRSLPYWIAGLLLAVAAWQFGSGVSIHAKATLGQVLMERAWARVQAGEAQARPWPWADTWPVARLSAPAHDREMIVLAGADGRTMAWGPGHLHGTAALGEAGLAILGGHRDTHFRFLEDLAPGDILRVETAEGASLAYRVTGESVVHHREAAFAAAPGRRRLALVTCWPFDAIAPGGPLRYVVEAEAAGGPAPHAGPRR
jgi:sortase A